MSIHRGKIQGLDPKGIMGVRKNFPFNHLRWKTRFFRIICQRLITLRVPTPTSDSVSMRTFLEACSSWQRSCPSQLVSSYLVNPNQRSSNITHFPKRGKWPLQSHVHAHFARPFTPCVTRGVVQFTLQTDGWIKKLLPVEHFCCGQPLYMLQSCLFNSLACNW